MNWRSFVCFGAALSSLFTSNSFCCAQGATFTYQGHLNDGGFAANGTYDLQFTLWDAQAAGSVLGATNNLPAVGVTNGLFTVALNFGTNFSGANRWLEIGVQTNGGTNFTVLAPRQPVTPAPYAITSANATQLAGQLSSVGVLNQNTNPVDWTSLKNVPASLASGSVGSVTSITSGAGLAGGTITSAGIISVAAGGITSAMLNSSNDYVGNSFTGNGAGLTNLATPTSANFIYAYDLNSQGIVSNSVFQDITVGSNGSTNGWTHTPGTATFTCSPSQSGIYLIQYGARIYCYAAPSTVTVRCLLDGVELPGGASDVDLNIGNSLQCGRGFLAPITAGLHTVKFQVAANNANADAVAIGFTAGTPSPTFSVSIIRIQ